MEIRTKTQAVEDVKVGYGDVIAIDNGHKLRYYLITHDNDSGGDYYTLHNLKTGKKFTNPIKVERTRGTHSGYIAMNTNEYPLAKLIKDITETENNVKKVKMIATLETEG